MPVYLLLIRNNSNSGKCTNSFFLIKRKKNRGRQRKKRKEKTVSTIKLNINQRAIPV